MLLAGVFTLFLGSVLGDLEAAYGDIVRPYGGDLDIPYGELEMEYDSLVEDGSTLALGPQKEYNVGVLMFTKSRANRFNLEHIGPAIDLAADSCQRDYGVKLNLIPGHYTTGCSAVQAIGRATDIAFSNERVTAYVGPACSRDLDVVGHFATYRQIPVVTGLGDVVADRALFPTLVRTSYNLEDKARAILAFLRHLEWKYFGLVVRREDVYYGTLAQHVRKLASLGDFTVTCEEAYVRDRNKTILTDLEALLKRMKTCARVIVILGGDRDVRQMLLLSSHLGMAESGNYAFLYPELIQSEASGNQSWASGSEDDATKEILKRAYQSLMIVSLNQPVSEEFRTFSSQVKARALADYNFTYDEEVPNYFTASFYDAVILLCRAINETVESGRSPLGNNLVSRLKNITFQGISGYVAIDEDGDRIANYALLDQIDTETGNFELTVQYYGATNNYSDVQPIAWPGGSKPLDYPPCGFDGNDPSCHGYLKPHHVSSIALVLVLLIGGAAIFYFYRKWKRESDLKDMNWKVRWDDIDFGEKFRESSLMKRMSISSEISDKMGHGWVSWSPPDCRESSFLEPIVDELPDGQEIVLAGKYKGSFVSVRKMALQKKVDLNRKELVEIKQIRDLHHDNLSRFVGACVDPPHISIISEHCPKGTLQDVLHKESLKLDWLFRYSLINDLVKGLCYLHNSEIGSHGRLRSTNCVVDAHFVLKISDYGLHFLRQHETYRKAKAEGDLSGFLWKAPELLRLDYCPSRGTQKGDIYSFGIILQEIILRDFPYCPYYSTISIAEIVQQVYAIRPDPFRPRVEPTSCSPELYNLMTRCWSESPDLRPDCQQIKSEMRSINRGQNGEVNIMDNLLTRMEQYANNLEELVEQRTAAFLDEKKRSEELLYQVLPRSVAEQLKKGNAVEPELYDCVTIYFSDIVGFTTLCSSSTPMQVVDFLNDLYTCFDSIISDFNVYKVETIGDAYMVVSGLPERNGLMHACEIARMALRLLRAIENFTIRHSPGTKVKLRIGIHSGPCCAGVVGQKMPRYCLFGDTVNTASRMESTGEPLRIHVSSYAKLILDNFPTFHLAPRGEVEVKGKGRMQTYWLLSEAPSLRH